MKDFLIFLSIIIIAIGIFNIASFSCEGTLKEQLYGYNEKVTTDHAVVWLDSNGYVVNYIKLNK